MDMNHMALSSRMQDFSNRLWAIHSDPASTETVPALRETFQGFSGDLMTLAVAIFEEGDLREELAHMAVEALFFGTDEMYNAENDLGTLVEWLECTAKAVVELGQRASDVRRFNQGLPLEYTAENPLKDPVQPLVLN